MSEQQYTAIVTTLETYGSLDELKEIIRRYGRGPVHAAALRHFAGTPTERARVQADLKRAADDIDAEEMTL
jgi:hypothetical protein